MAVVRVSVVYTVNVKAQKACDVILFDKNKHLLPPESRKAIEDLERLTGFARNENAEMCDRTLEIKGVELASLDPPPQSCSKDKNSDKNS